jgi:site-specific recombinase XerD
MRCTRSQIGRSPIVAERVRRIDGGFCFSPHRFLRDGFFAGLSQHELLLYFLLVLAGDRYGVSFYSCDAICALLFFEEHEYLAARNELIAKDLIAFDGKRFQVLSLPERRVTTDKALRTEADFEEADPSPRTIRAYAFDLLAIYRWMDTTGYRLLDLNQSVLLEFIANEQGRGAQPCSINRRLTVCRLLYNFYYPDGLEIAPGTSLPAPYYRRPGRDRALGIHRLKKKRKLALPVKTPNKQIRPLSAEQVRKFLRSLRRYRDMAIVYLMLFSGLRSREVLQLGRHDISLLERQGRVVGKGNKERILKDISIGIDISGPIITHRLRHTYATELLNAGMSLFTIMKLLGHRCIDMTLRYAAITQETVIKDYLSAMGKISNQYKLPGKYTATVEANPQRLLIDAISWLRNYAADDTQTPRLITRIYKIHDEIARLIKQLH